MYAIADRGGSGYKMTTLRLYTIEGLFRSFRQRQRADIIRTEPAVPEVNHWAWKEQRRPLIINQTFQEWMNSQYSYGPQVWYCHENPTTSIDLKPRKVYNEELLQEMIFHELPVDAPAHIILPYELADSLLASVA